MKTTILFGCIMMACMVVIPISSLGQNNDSAREKELALKIRDSRKIIDTFQAFGVLTQDGPIFAPEPSKPGETSSWSRQKFFYVAFQNENGRISQRQFSEEEMQKKERHTIDFYSSSSTGSMYYGSAGFHMAQNSGGGRYIFEGDGNSTAFPVQTLGFWVSEEKKWPDELLDSGRYRIVGERNSAKFHKMIDIEGKTTDNHPTRFTLAPEFGYRVVSAETEDENSKYVTELESVTNINGIWCPKRFTRRIESKKGYAASTQEFDLDKIVLNDAKKDEILFKSVTGDHNHSMKTDRSSYTLADGSRKYVELSKDNQSFFSLLKGWLYMASVITLLVLTVGAYIRWKRNQLLKSA